MLGNIIKGLDKPKTRMAVGTLANAAFAFYTFNYIHSDCKKKQEKPTSPAESLSPVHPKS
ncbi:MAG: hypothetical protein K0S29_635 [Gammaproteobacteria bacterium]|nr:hypothetical protein [Gammaproteobacteria bacterium]